MQSVNCLPKHSEGVSEPLFYKNVNKTYFLKLTNSKVTRY